jgi:hypothetical protein
LNGALAAVLLMSAALVLPPNLDELLEKMTPAEREQFDALLPTWSPNPGPQTASVETEADELLMGGGAGGGKALGLSTAIATPYGWATMGGLRKNDEVLDGQGRPCRVVAMSDVHYEDTHCVVFSDRSEIVAGARHQWVTELAGIRTTREIAGVPLANTDKRALTVIPTERVPLKCIQVDSPSHCFLAGPGMIPTHNSDLLLGLAATRHRKSIIFRREFGQAKDLIERAQAIAGRYGVYNGQTYALRIKRPGEPNHNIEFAGCQYEDDKEKYRGRAHDFKGFDELTDFTYSQYKFLTAWLRTIVPEQRCRIVATCNPPSTPEGRWVIDYWAPWLDPKHPRPAKPGELRWFAMVGGKDIEVQSGAPIHTPLETIFPTSRTFIPARINDNPDLVRTGYRRALQNLPEPLRSQMLFGDFSAGLEDDAFQVVPTAWALEAMNRWRKTPQPSITQTVIGVDVARGGRDKTVLAPRHAWWFAELMAFPGSETRDGSTVSAAVLPLHAAGGYVAIDADGVGASPYDSLVEAGADVMPVRFSEGAPDHSSDRSGLLRFGNLRAYCYWRLREALDPDKEKNPEPIALPDDRELLADITAPRYRQRAGRLFIEDKDEIKKRIGRSPDKGDAVAVTFAASEDSGAVETPTIKYARAEWTC